MKKSMIALAVLAATAGVAQAATSVTLYGRADVGYTNSTGTVLVPKNTDLPDGTNAAAAFPKSAAYALKQSGNGENRFGIKGEEDLGAGYAGTFQFEGRFEGDVGAKTAGKDMFDRESTVGLKTPYGAVRFGHSLAAMERGIGFINVGRRSADKSPYSSAARHSNSAFYDNTIGAVSFGGNVSTRGGAVGYTTIDPVAKDVTTSANDSEGAGRASYGVYAKYSANGLTAGAAFQRDEKNMGTAANKNSKEFGLGVSYVFAPVAVGLSFAQAKSETSAKSRVIQGYIGANVSAADQVGMIARKTQTKSAAGVRTAAGFGYGLGYVHSLSKRTSAYANILQQKDDIVGSSVDAKATVWEAAIRHNF